MKNNGENTVNISHDFDQLLLVMEEIVKKMFSMMQQNAQEKELTEQPEIGKETAVNKIMQEPVIAKSDMNELDKLKNDFMDVRRKIVAKIKEQSLTNEPVNLSLIKGNVKDEAEIISGLKDLGHIVIDAQALMATAIAEKEAVKRNSLLRSLGERLIQIDEKREALTKKISDYFTNLPGQIKENFAALVVGKLQDITNKMENLTQTLNDCLTPNVEIVSNPDLVTADKKILPDAEVVPDIQSMPDDDKTLIEKIRELLSVLELDIANTSKDAKYLNFALEPKETTMDESQNIVGIRTEIDPEVGVFETLNGNEKSGLKTVASVKEEIEDITLTDYSPHEEEAYHHGVDPDPDVATMPTPSEEEWDQLYGYGQER